MITFLTPRAGEFTIREYLELYAPALADRFRVLRYEELPERPAIQAGAFVFAGLDQLTPGGLRLVEELAGQLSRQDSGCRILNRPSRSLLRFDLLTELERRALNRHRVARATGDLASLRYPVFVREESHHSGTLTPLLHAPKELDRALGRLVLQGYQLSELLVLEFCATADGAGNYRKYAAFRVGERIVADGLTRGTAWMLKSDTRELSAEAILEERDYILTNPHEAELRALFALAGIEYGRIDYALRDGRIETWEINTLPTIRRGRTPDARPTPPELDQLKNPARRHFLPLLEAAFRELDAGLAARPLAIDWNEDLLRAATPITRTHGPAGWRAPLFRALRWMRPALEPVVRGIAPLVARWARRG